MHYVYICSQLVILIYNKKNTMLEVSMFYRLIENFHRKKTKKKHVLKNK